MNESPNVFMFDDQTGTYEDAVIGISEVTGQKSHDAMSFDTSANIVSQIFEGIAWETPDATAISFRGRSLTYATLNRRANGLARRLKYLGVGPETLVCVAIDRSPAFVIAILAIMKAGGAYVPFDLGYPSERLRRMLDDARPSVLLSTTELTAEWAGNCNDDSKETPMIRLSLGGEWAEGIAAEESDLAACSGPRSAAYVMYTSGSSGTPKGVVIEQRSIVRLVCNPGYLEIGPHDTFLQLAPTCFDASTFEIWGALLNGARLVVMEPGTLDFAEIAKTIQKEHITILWLTAGLFHAMVDDHLDSLASVRFMLAGGDVVSPRHVERFLDAHRTAVFINGYGPTEGTTFTCCHSVRFGERLGTSVPIGRPIKRTNVLIFDELGKLVVSGEEGELYIGGEGLARGYLNQPELTAERFVMSPLGGGQTLYRSGDLVKLLPDGSIAFLGRRDDQVKIRGFRVEPGEIEAALLQHPNVKQAVVIVRSEQTDLESAALGTLEKKIHAFWTPRPGAPKAVDLATYPATQLPSYMVPASITCLETFPLTANGKVDRNRLAAMIPASFVAVEYVPPSDTLELQLIEIWEEVLGVSRIGVRHDFFDLGGHSFLAAKMFAQLRVRLNQTLPLATLYHSSTIETLAAVIRKGGFSEHWSSLVPIQKKGSRTPIFLIHGLRGNVLTYSVLRNYLSPEQPIYGLQAQGLNADRGAFFSLEDVASHYISLMREAQPRGPYLIGGFSAGGLIAFEMAQQLHKAGEEVGLLALFDSSVDVVGGHWIEAFYSIHALRRTLRIFRHHYGAELRSKGSGAFFRARVRHLTRDVRIGIWRIARKTASILGLREGPINYLTVAEAAMLAIRTYRAKPYDGSAILFRTVGSDYENPDPSNGFSRYVRGNLQIEEIAGLHVDMFREPNIRILAERLQKALDQTDSDDRQL